MTGLYFLITSSMPKYLQSTKLSKILTELYYLQFLRSIIQQHLTIITAYIPDYIETITLNARTFVPRKSADFRATRRSWITRSPGISKFALRLPKHNCPESALRPPIYFLLDTHMWTSVTHVDLWHTCGPLAHMWTFGTHVDLC